MDAGRSKRKRCSLQKVMSWQLWQRARWSPECDVSLPPLAAVCGLPKFSRKLMARIFNGRPAVKGTTPWIAMLSHLNGQPFCGGSLLGKEKVEGMGDQG